MNDVAYTAQFVSRYFTNEIVLNPYKGVTNDDIADEVNDVLWESLVKMIVSTYLDKVASHVNNEGTK